jgi:hypothetical protein
LFDCRTERHGGKRRDRRHTAADALDPWRAEEMIAFVEGHLGITAAQRQAWERFAETLRDSVDAMRTARSVARNAEPGALARFSGFETITETASAALRRIRPALESLYDALDGAQRRSFDDLFSHGVPEAYRTRH